MKKYILPIIYLAIFFFGYNLSLAIDIIWAAKLSDTGYVNIKVSPDKKLIYAFGKDSTLYKISAIDGSLVDSHKFNNLIKSVAFSDDFKHLVLALDSCRIAIYDLNNYSKLNQYIIPEIVPQNFPNKYDIIVSFINDTSFGAAVTFSYYVGYNPVYPYNVRCYLQTFDLNLNKLQNYDINSDKRWIESLASNRDKLICSYYSFDLTSKGEIIHDRAFKVIDYANSKDFSMESWSGQGNPGMGSDYKKYSNIDISTNSAYFLSKIYSNGSSGNWSFDGVWVYDIYKNSSRKVPTGSFVLTGGIPVNLNEVKFTYRDDNLFLTYSEQNNGQSTFNKGYIVIIDYVNNKLIDSISITGKNLNFNFLLAHSHDSTFFVSASDDGFVRLYKSDKYPYSIKEFKSNPLQNYVSPNPATDILHLSGLEGDRIEIYNAMGIKVLETEFNENLDVLKLQSGMYYLRVKCGSNYFTAKFAIVR